MLIAILLYLIVGLANMVVSFDQDVLMIKEELNVDSVVEAVFYVLLWPLQALWFILTRLSRLPELLQRALGGD